MINSFAEKTVFTTGEVAQICSISQQTVIRCFDSGRLKGFRVPGSKFRRIPKQNLLEFMNTNDIPLDKLETQSKRVLIIDDDHAIVDMLSDLLQRERNYEIRVGHTGFDAGLITREFMPDIILLDFKLPDIDGTAVCRSIRNNPQLSHIRIIMISGVADPGEVESLRVAGADAFIKKPFSVDEVLGRIAELVGR